MVLNNARQSDKTVIADKFENHGWLQKDSAKTAEQRKHSNQVTTTTDPWMSNVHFFSANNNMLFIVQTKLMQCFQVGYPGICYASLVFSVIYTRAFRLVCIRRKYKWQVTHSMVSHEKALHNYFIPCLNFRKTYVNFRNLWKGFKPIIEELLCKKTYEKFGKSLAIFGNSSKVFSRCFYDF